MKSSMETRLKHIIPHNFVNNRRKYTKLAHMIGHDPPCWFMLIYIGYVTLRMKARLKHIIFHKFVKKNPYHAKLAHLSQLDILHRLVPLCSVTWPHTWTHVWCVNTFKRGACFQHELHTGPYFMTFAPRLTVVYSVFWIRARYNGSWTLTHQGFKWIQLKMADKIPELYPLQYRVLDACANPKYWNLRVTWKTTCNFA